MERETNFIEGSWFFFWHNDSIVFSLAKVVASQ